MTELSKAALNPDSTSSPDTLYLGEQAEWWRGAVIYQVYPRSFQDSNGDGIGDLRGIINKLEHIVSLGVDALWVSPFFKSPMKDFGYDISDYRDVDPIFGSLDDFDALVAKCKEHGLKIMIDQVLSHTSDQHPWFVESRVNKTNPKSDWYVWADANSDGSPPNNWLSIFGGSAWQWDATREQFYLHNFLDSQPDLNYHNEEVRQQILEEMEFWLKRGVDGFRLDAINFCYHDKQLRSNPFKPMEERTGRGFSPDNPYAAQYHLFDNTQSENLEFMESIRNLLDRYDGSVALGEINSETSLKTLAEYTQGNKRLQMGYNFELLADEFSVQHITDTVTELEHVIEEGWPCWAVSNHDVTRVVSRWGSGRNEAQFAKLILALAASLRGTLCVFQGEELGYTEAEIEREQLQDPFGIEFWPEFKGRDGCRTPIAWDSQSPFAGFSNASAWLPIAEHHRLNSVERQNADAKSPLNFYRSFLAWRSRTAVLKYGEIAFHDSKDEDVLIFERILGDDKLLCIFNLADRERLAVLPMSYLNHSVAGPTKECAYNKADNTLSVPSYGLAYLKS